MISVRRISRATFAAQYLKRYAEAEAESRGGNEILVNKVSPGAAWLINAHKDLVEEYDALQNATEAAKFRAELVALENKNSEIARK